MDSKLIQKYNIPGPRYTSYPTVPFWNKEGISDQDWKSSTIKSDQNLIIARWNNMNQIEGR